MRYLNYRDLDTLIHYDDVKCIMSENLEEIKNRLITSLPDFTYSKIYSGSEKEYVYEFRGEEIDIRCDYDWSQGSLILGFEVVDNNNRGLSLDFGWQSQKSENESVYYKYVKMMDFIFLENRIEEEFKYNLFLDETCSQIINSITNNYEN